jgi:hypothetical protein
MLSKLAFAFVLGAYLLAYSIAQTKVAFTSTPAVAVAGQSYNISWGGGDGSPVTITLRKGDPADLDTIRIIAEGITGRFYSWTVSPSLSSASYVNMHG